MLLHPSACSCGVADASKAKSRRFFIKAILIRLFTNQRAAPWHGLKFKLLRSNLAHISSCALNLPSAEPSNSAFKKQPLRRDFYRFSSRKYRPFASALSVNPRQIYAPLFTFSPRSRRQSAFASTVSPATRRLCRSPFARSSILAG